MNRFEGVADTLYIPLTARIYVTEHFPEYFRDDKAVSLKSEMSKALKDRRKSSIRWIGFLISPTIFPCRSTMSPTGNAVCVRSQSRKISCS